MITVPGHLHGCDYSHTISYMPLCSRVFTTIEWDGPTVYIVLYQIPDTGCWDPAIESDEKVWPEAVTLRVCTEYIRAEEYCAHEAKRVTERVLEAAASSA